MKIDHARTAGLFAGAATIALFAASAEAHSSLGPIWMTMIAGVASVGAVVRNRRARGVAAADV